MNGYTGKILRVDLTSRRVTEEPLNEDFARAYLGCQGLGLRYLFDEVTPGADPLGPENAIVLVTGPICGTSWPTGQKYTIVSKSPLTKTFYDSTAGGHFGPELKYAGYDGIIITGKADAPVYLLIRNGRVQIMNARRLWGKTSHEVEDRLKEMWGDVKVLSIGPAGENLVRFACLNTEYYRQNGRGGHGAVFGSKNLKAIVVKGSGAVSVADPEAFNDYAYKLVSSGFLDNEDAQGFIGWKGMMGTLSLMDWTQEEGVLPTRNFQSGSFEGKEKIDQEAYRARKKSSRACCQCPMACGSFTVAQGEYEGAEVEGPEFETSGAYGANCGVDDRDAIIQLNVIADALGMDTISSGITLAWAMEATERGVLTPEDTGGVDLRFGDYHTMCDVLYKMAHREPGIGDLLADGVARASQRIGKGSEDYAMHSKGLEFPLYDARVAIGMGLAYATSPPGATHTRGYPISAELFGAWWLSHPPIPDIDPKSPVHKASLVKQQQHWQAYRFSTGTCDFGLWGPEDGLPEGMALCTGWQESADWDLMGERIVNLAQLFALREGVKKHEWTLPKRQLEEPLGPGVSEGRQMGRENFEYMLEEYFRLRGWDENGVPGPEILAKMGLESLGAEVIASLDEEVAS